MFRREFGVEVVGVDTLTEAEQYCERNGNPDLILVNRKLDIDYSDGMELIRSLKAARKTAETPVMLVSNYPEYQAQAVALGAMAGFGKSELGQAATTEKLRPILG
jgi:two-component system chemotaxis response regulator CheY